MHWRAIKSVLVPLWAPMFNYAFVAKLNTLFRNTYIVEQNTIPFENNYLWRKEKRKPG